MLQRLRKIVTTVRIGNTMIRQHSDAAAPTIDEQQLTVNDAELLAKILGAGTGPLDGIIALRRESSRPVHKSHYRTDCGKSNAQEKCVLLHETCASLFPDDDGSHSGTSAEWRVVLFHDGDLEVVPAGWVTPETAKEAADDSAMERIQAEHRLLIDAVQNGGMRALRQSGRPIHQATCFDTDGERGATAERCAVLGEIEQQQGKEQHHRIALFAFGAMQALPDTWVSEKPVEAAGKLNEDALRIYALQSQHAITEAAHGKHDQSELDAQRDAEQARRNSHIT
eukprot:COSAG02_NODE_15510_length_1164_cov_1.472300_1_plen_281_part_01